MDNLPDPSRLRVATVPVAGGHRIPDNKTGVSASAINLRESDSIRGRFLYQFLLACRLAAHQELPGNEIHPVQCRCDPRWLWIAHHRMAHIRSRRTPPPFPPGKRM